MQKKSVPFQFRSKCCQLLWLYFRIVTIVILYSFIVLSQESASDYFELAVAFLFIMLT